MLALFTSFAATGLAVDTAMVQALSEHTHSALCICGRSLGQTARLFRSAKSRF